MRLSEQLRLAIAARASEAAAAVVTYDGSRPDVEGDGADAATHGYGVDRNPYLVAKVDRSGRAIPDTARLASMRGAWSKGWLDTSRTMAGA